MGLLYSLSIRFYGIAIWLAAFFNPKAKAWIEGRRDWRSKLKTVSNLEDCIWFHCASLGEFEQGRPLIEEIKSRHPSKKVLLTFYSPSGYEIRKNYALADHVCYLPLDTKKEARDFVAIAKPSMAIIVKYEVWHRFFTALHESSIPTFMVSAIFRPSQIYFKPWGKWFRQSLLNCTHIFTQDEESRKLLSDINLKNISIAGDTRFDRVIAIADAAKTDTKLAEFTKGHFTIVAGSTWPEDEALIFELLKKHQNIRVIIAPHETHAKRIEGICAKSKNIARWTDSDALDENDQVLVLDTIGLLSAAYKYGNVALIGGGFGKGIHNTLEAAVYEIPVLFGPNFQKFKEARDLINLGGAHEISNAKSFKESISTYFNDVNLLHKDGNAAGNYVASNAGATATILKTLNL